MLPLPNTDSGTPHIKLNYIKLDFPITMYPDYSVHKSYNIYKFLTTKCSNIVNVGSVIKRDACM